MKVNGTNLSMIRGDSESITVSCTDSDNVSIPIVTGDKIYFTVKTNASTDVKLIQKIITNFTDGKAIINILPTDTSSMKFGNYKYDVQLTRVDGTVTTICIGQFTLLEEITYE